MQGADSSPEQLTLSGIPPDEPPGGLAALPEQAASRLILILDDYLERLKTGSAPPRAQLIAEHPELAEQLEACLSGLEFIHGASRADAEHPARLGDFRILREVGRGGMGVVYEAEQQSLKRRVALKVLRFGGVSDGEAVERFQREAETVAGLHHTNIVPIFAVGQEQGVAYYAMQFIHGHSLADVLNRLQQGAPPVPAAELVRWGLQAAEALTHAHDRGVIHRDVKPSNLIQDEHGRLWLTDFGLAKRLDDVTLSMTGALLGTPRYMSPEQASAARHPVDARTDLYSLGATLYELATGQPVFDADSPYAVITQILTADPRPPRRLRPDLPRDLETILLRCLAKDPARRYQSARELASDLRAFEEGRPIRSRRASLAERAVRLAKKHRRSATVAAVSAAVAVLLIAVGLSAWTRYQQHQLRKIFLQTEGPPLAAELVDATGRVAATFTVPMQTPLDVPAGDYELHLTGSNRVGERYRVDLVSRATAQGNLSLEPRGLWEPLAVEQGGTSWLVELQGRPALIVAEGDRLRRLDAEARPVWSTRWTQQPPLEANRAIDSRQLAEAHLLRPPPDLDGDGCEDLVWVWLGEHRPHQLPGTLVAVSGRTGDRLWTFQARRAAPGQDAAIVSGTMLIGPPLVMDRDGDGSLEVLQPIAAHGALLDRPITSPESAKNLPPGVFSTHELIQWSWVEVLDGRTGRSRGAIAHSSGPRSTQVGPAGLEYGLAVAELDGQPAAVLVTERGFHVLQGASNETAHVEFGFERIGVPRVADLAGLCTLVLRREGPDAPLALLAVEIPNGKIRWQYRGVAPWPHEPLPVLPLPAAEWPLIQDLNGDGRREVLIGSAESRGSHAAAVGVASLDSGDGRVQWRTMLGTALGGIGQPRILVGPDLDGDGYREVFAAALLDEPNSPDGSSTLAAAALSGADGTPLWSWRRAMRAAPLRAGLDVLQWWQTGPDGHPLLLLSPYEGGPLDRENRRFYALQAGSGEVVHTLRYDDARRVEPADLDGDGLLDLIVHPDASEGARSLQAIRGRPAEPWRRLESCQPLPDLDHDGVGELLRVSGNIGKTCFSGRDARVLWRVAETGPRHVQPVSDVDGDGVADLLGSDLGGSSEPLEVRSGRTGKRLWISSLKAARTEMFHTQYLQPHDLDGDGKPELVYIYEPAPWGAVGESTRQRWLAVLSGADGRLRWKQPLTGIEPWHRLSRLGGCRPAVGDLNHDGRPDLAVWVATPGREFQLCAFRGTDGAELWRQRLPLPTSEPGSPPDPPARMVATFADLSGDGQPLVLLEVQPDESGSAQGSCELWALEAAGGRPIWTWRGAAKRNGELDPTPLVYRREGRHHGIAFLTGGSDSQLQRLNLLDAAGNLLAAADIDSPPLRFDAAKQLRFEDLDGDGRDEVLRMAGGHLHVTRGDLTSTLWQWPLPDGGEILSVLPAAETAPPVVAVWNGQAVYGLEATTGTVRWFCPGPEAPARQLEAAVLGTASPAGLPRVMFQILFDPHNYANTATVCRQALPGS